VKIHFSKITNLASVFFLIFISFSCLSTKPLLIEIPQKSTKELPEHIQSLLLIARIDDDRYTDLTTDSLQRIFYKQGFSYDTIINDLQTVDTTLRALGDLLFESGRYDYVIPEYRFPKVENTSLIAGEMPWNEVKELCDTFMTDAILSLDYFKTRVITDYNKTSNFNVYTNAFSDQAYAEMKISYEALFRVYDPLVEKVIVRRFMRDTIIWEATDRSARDLFYWFTPVKKALTETGIAIALDLSGEISPRWRTEKRSFFASGESNFKQAVPLVNSGQWETAITLWKETVENAKSKSVKSKAEFNIALGYEMLGNIEESIAWALQSYNTMYRTNTFNYLETLNRRKTEINNQ
jgi:tetratricopeptide (TPR) repeat protein